MVAPETPEEVAELLDEVRRAGGPEDGEEVAELLADFRTWESVRERVSRSGTSARILSELEATKLLVLFDGVPGAGKSTQLDLLKRRVGAAYFSMARFAEAAGISQDERRVHQLEALSLHPTDVALLDQISAVPNRYVVVEKFARTPVEARALVERASREGWRLEVVHLRFEVDPVGASVERQLLRGARRGRASPSAREARRRALTHLSRGASGRWTLAALGVPVHRLDATKAPNEIEDRLRRALGLSFERVGWHSEPLIELAEVARELGIDAWVGGGALYRPFWGARFGPAQLPTDVDVAVDAQTDVAPLLDALNRKFPHRRWSVLCPSDRLERRYGLRTAGVREAKAHEPFLHRAGAVRWSGDAVDVCLAEGSEASLRGGVVRLNPLLLDKLAGAERERMLSSAADRLQRTLRDYPSVALEPSTAEKLQCLHQPVRIRTSWQSLKALVAEEQRHSAERPRSRRAINGEARECAERLLRLHRESECLPEAAPRPLRVDLPAPLEEIRRAKVKDKAGLALGSEERATLAQREVSPPAGHASWLHFIGTQGDDAVFREWFLDQMHHRQPLGGADPLVRGVLGLSLFAGRLPGATTEQGPLHQGWQLPRHLAESVLALETDELARSFELADAPLRSSDVRLCLRLAMLFHDTGKLVGPRAAGRHPQIGAKLWRLHRPHWLAAHLIEPVAWMIETHDVLGALCRGITDKLGAAPGSYGVELGWATSYPAALDAPAARARLRQSGWSLERAAEVNVALWRADLGAIPALRWARSSAAVLGEIIVTDEVAVGTGVAERRR